MLTVTVLHSHTKVTLYRILIVFAFPIGKLQEEHA
jgi:hypothetical protein